MVKLWRELWAMVADFEHLFLTGSVRSRRPAPAYEATKKTRQPTERHATAIPDWMSPPPSAQPRRALPMEVVSALMTLGLASPPAPPELKRLIRRALADAHPDRHAAHHHAAMTQRLHEVQKAREILRRHGFAE
jgi:hypothetical protein